ncbi:MAG: ATP-binding protein [Rickettsiales bacterium]
MYSPRTLAKFIKKNEKQFPVLLVTGPRQVGKTTLLKNLSKKNRKYVTLDNSELRLLAKEDPQLFLERFKPPVMIDEVQYAPELLPYIKIYVDNHKKPGDFWLTGSQQFHLMKGVSESLAGRVGILNLLGLSLREVNANTTGDEPFVPTAMKLKKRFAAAKSQSLQSIYEIIWRGSFPAISLHKKADMDYFYSSYVQTYLERDVRDLANIGDLSSFLKFVRSAAARTGQLLNMSEMARDAGIKPATAKSWLSILEASGLVYLLEPYYTNLIKRFVKAPKLYFLDTGLASYLTRWSSPETLESGSMSGAILETFIFTEILKSYWHNGKREPLYYYRNKDEKEIDLLIVEDGTVYPLEFKKTSRPNKADIKHFNLVESLGLKVGEGGVICLAGEYIPITKSIHVLPIKCL